tara:strand:+ start:213 stop:497 length:285 start_codon:yes stop_codon:yes gene_type:complete
MSVQYHDPRAEPITPVEPYRLSADLNKDITIGLLANGFPDSDTFLGEVERVLEHRLPRAQFRHYNKRNASIRVTEAMLKNIVAECGVVLAAYGH